MPSISKRICVIGLGYIGLPTAAVLAESGFDVIGVDVDKNVIRILNEGRIHIEEPGLEDLVKQVVGSGKFKASTKPTFADVFIICVPTPFNADKSPDLSYVKSASNSIKEFIEPGNLVILESTSPPLTTKNVVCPAAIPSHLRIGKDIFVAHCPERVIPGSVLREVQENDRIVGGVTSACALKAQELYNSFVTGEVITTNSETAELTKLVENASRDVNLAFANELSIYAKELGADPFEVIELANRHPRVNILNPGPGVGGHCISVDPWFIVHAAPESTSLIRLARKVNDEKPSYVVQQIIKAASRIRLPKIGCLGLTYKANVDDFRESPSLEIATKLGESGIGQIFVTDPFIRDGLVDSTVTIGSLEEVIQSSDILVLLTDHEEYKNLYHRISPTTIIIDTRGCWRKAMLENQEDVRHTRIAA